MGTTPYAPWATPAAVQVKDRSLIWNTDLIETMELENLLINAAVTMHSAEARKVGGWGFSLRHVDMP